MKSLFAALASVGVLAVPLAASAQPGGGYGDYHGGYGRGGQAAAPPVNPGGPNRPAPAPVNPGGPNRPPAGPQPGVPGGYAGGHGGWDHPGAPGGAYGWQGQHPGGAPPARGFAGPGPGFGAGRPGYAWGGRGYPYRAYDPRFARDFRWAVGAYLPRYDWAAIVDPYAYGLGAAPWGYHWVVVDGEALLIQDGTGAIAQAFLL